MVATADHQILLGLGGNDVLLSEFSDTTLDGGNGNDRPAATAEAEGERGYSAAHNNLNGGDGADRMTGGDGKDLFVLTAGDTALNTIVDFSGAPRAIRTKST